MTRVGIGYDVHRLVPDRPLILGGIKIPFANGLQGHSDADVLIHAICDAILGALGLGDIGRHFPDSDPAYKGIASSILLSRVIERMAQHHYAIGNLDAIVIAEQPRLAPYIPQMQDHLARLMHASPERINIKATTTEGLGFTGTGAGIAAQTIVSLISEAMPAENEGNARDAP
ncbi:2-C-methyl-D-erythritol 2,4-cyclodiphosphate synthase [candidate division KSB3 bacterium]|uniref:2-C-methyl-D-erythritol 2,4-cyclodiphosphate synthase n=1 Tax=candidate division KSB3 bacterium TaxID=2044937 RepID=A0A9D5JSP7_9BACT|nr:2-C-methyl-D-erythritol 2,4-cyclodiphosphate synthase [candidate division KSB3 bacterium]MBD3323329.1 2-C-methyl-D-erythritol 2,4-cyclodiphosphate synthase [candidate division KSB3 bacterium]